MGEPRDVDPERFIQASKNLFRRAPAEKPERTDGAGRAALFGLAAAAMDYLIGPQLFGTDRSGSSDETSAFFALAAGVLIGSIKNLRTLCATEPEKKAEDNLNVTKAGVGGALAGAGLLKLLPVALLTLPIDAGVTLAGTVVAGTGAVLYNKFRRKKYCPYADCLAKGHCKQSVCRTCHRLFYPDDTKIDCKDTPLLTWNRIATHLQKRQLSYLDAECVVRDHIAEWEVYNDSTKTNLFVDCATFLDWTDKNLQLVVGYKGKGAAGRSQDQISHDLDQRGL